MAQTYLSALDNGPVTCLLLKYASRFNTYKSIELLYSVFPFLQGVIEGWSPISAKMERLCSLHKVFESFDEACKKKIIRRGVCEYIYFSNQIEFTGPSTIDETENALCEGLAESKSTAVSALFKSASHNYKPPGNGFKSRAIDLPYCHRLHRILSAGIQLDQGEPGKLREIGVMASGRTFLHHTKVKDCINLLFRYTFDLLKAADAFYVKQIFSEKWNNLKKQVVCFSLAFSIAAFLQFHFVDIHPYGDGNGRMCRILSKRLLDEVLLVPFPQFRSRENYIKALEKCRSKWTVEPLFDLLLNEAIEGYAVWTDVRVEQLIFIGPSKTEVLEDVKTYSDNYIMNEIQHILNDAVDDDDVCIITERYCVIVPKKDPEWDECQKILDIPPINDL